MIPTIRRPRGNLDGSGTADYLSSMKTARTTSGVSSGADARERNLRYLDAICRWAEALVDMRTAEAFGADLDETHRQSLRDLVAAAEREAAGLAAEAVAAGSPLPFPALAERLGLTEDEVAILRLTLVPVLDASFRKRIARFKDNVLLDYVDVDFLLGVLHENRLDRLRARDLFSPEGRLAREHLLTLSLPRDATSDTLLAHEVRIPDGVVHLVLGLAQVDKALASLCTLTRPDVGPESLVMDEHVRDEVLALLKGSLGHASGRGLVIGLFGPPGTGKSLLASVAASVAGRPLLTVDSARLAVDEGTFRETLDALFSDARMRGAVVALDHCEALFSQKNPRIPSVYSWFERHPGVVFLLTNDPRQLDPSLERYIAYQVDFEAPDVGQRERLWDLHARRAGLSLAGDADLPGLALNFEFTGGQIANAVAVARDLAGSRGDEVVAQADLTAGAWAQVRADMEEYSKKRKVRLTLEDLILPEDEKKLVAEVLDAARHRTFIMTRWGFGRRLSTGRGLCCLFVGEPGTGKTLAAEILAEALGQNLYQISIPRVMSKYIGETEKNIERIFSTARANNSILLFDEADALFTTRVKVETSVDRFSNMEINLLLQEIERFDGIVILTTNLEKNLDKAFERRIQFKIRFPFPDPTHRARIWQALIPRECPVDPDIDWERVGRSFDLSGGHIKNAIVRAAYKAARDERRITLEHIVAAAEAECRAAGRLFRGLKAEDE